MGLAVRTLVVGPLQTNCYLASSEETREAIVVDPGSDAQRILRAIEEGGLTVRLIVDTHAHFDHVAANEAVRQATGAPIAVHRLEAQALTQPVSLFGLSFSGPASPPADRLLEDGEEIAVGEERLQVLLTPGHSPGGISLYHASGPLVFSGDALFCQGIGRTDLPGGDFRVLMRSIHKRLFALPGEAAVYPGHGPATTIAEERAGNPFVA